jgi:hypothetical protein
MLLTSPYFVSYGAAGCCITAKAFPMSHEPDGGKSVIVNQKTPQLRHSLWCASMSKRGRAWGVGFCRKGSRGHAESILYFITMVMVINVIIIWNCFFIVFF